MHTFPSYIVWNPIKNLIKLGNLNKMGMITIRAAFRTTCIQFLSQFYMRYRYFLKDYAMLIILPPPMRRGRDPSSSEHLFTPISVHSLLTGFMLLYIQHCLFIPFCILLYKHYTHNKLSDWHSLHYTLSSTDWLTTDGQQPELWISAQNRLKLHMLFY